MDAEERIRSFQKFGWKLGLERMRALCDLLGDPQDRLKVIHVAGTNGKGSVCRYLYEALLAHGHTVGLFTSPGLGDFRSRVEADGGWISADDLENCTGRVMDAVDKMDRHDPPTEFEVLTVVALVYFASRDLDFVILEVGLGGSADSTNIVSVPLVSVVTEISFDHMTQLGDTIERIAAEKAGIIKPGRPVVASARGEAAKVVARRAYELGAPLTDASERIVGVPHDARGAAASPGAAVHADGGSFRPRGGVPVRVRSESLGGSLFSCEIGGTRYGDIEISMPGRHQIRNAVCALAVFDVLRRMKDAHLPSYVSRTAPPLIRADAEALRRGLKAARLPGRFQIVSGGPAEPDDPLIVLDGAHNAAGAAALRAAVSSLLPSKKNLALMAVVRDKQADVILREISGFADGAIFTKALNERAADTADLAEMWADVSAASAIVIDDPREAYRTARAMVSAGEYDALVVCGSLYLISDIMKTACVPR
ncbi:MAG: hypothetical protein LBS67_02395 [Clostridiales Family XIII bacterium]|nr:hypothetical protein [Clostridiales Family XIII bacterium]